MTEFQFHYGTIKSVYAPLLINDHGEFQFHYGTIKRSPFPVIQSTLNVFQFHYGTIKRRIDLTDKNAVVKHFNSTMVRLKAEIATLTAERDSHFNSTMVRLKVIQWGRDDDLGLHFNSTMVRLKAKKRMLLIGKSHKISIPLWYD